MLEEQVNLHIRDQLNIERYMTGDGYVKIAKRFGMSRELVRYYLQNRRSSLPRPKPPPLTASQKNAVKERKKQSVKRCREVKYEYLKELFVNGCEICGETNPLVLEFDHIDPSEKKYSITKLICSAASLDTLKKELNKCRMLCSNCHTEHTHYQNQSWRWKMFGTK